MNEKEIEKLQQDLQEALSKISALQDELGKEKKSKEELQTKHDNLQSKYDKLVETSDQLRLLNGKMLLKQTAKDEDNDEDDPPTSKSLEEEVLDILKMKE